MHTHTNQLFKKMQVQEKSFIYEVSFDYVSYHVNLSFQIVYFCELALYKFEN